MTVTLVFDPHADPRLQAASVALNQPSRGVVSFAAQPGARRDLWLYHAILDALGKTSDDRHLLARARSHAGIYASAWLTAHDVDHIVFYGVGCTNGLDLSTMCLMADACGIDMTLIGDGSLTNTLRNEIDRWADREADAESHLADLARHVAERPVRSLTATWEAGFPQVPASDWTSFIDDCRRQLDPEDHERVTDSYESVRASFNVADFTDEAAIARQLAELLSETTSSDAHTTIVRGAQAAAFNNHFHLEVDVPGVLRNTASNVVVQAFTDDDWALVTASARPRLPSVVALVGAGVPESDIAAVPATDVADDGTQVTYGGRSLRIPEPAQVAIRAQHLVRRSFQVPPSEPFLKDSARYETRDIREQLNRMRAHTNTQVRVRYTTSNARWQYRTGITLTDLR